MSDAHVCRRENRERSPRKGKSISRIVTRFIISDAELLLQAFPVMTCIVHWQALIVWRGPLYQPVARIQGLARL